MPECEALLDRMVLLSSDTDTLHFSRHLDPNFAHHQAISQYTVHGRIWGVSGFNAIPKLISSCYKSLKMHKNTPKISGNPSNLDAWHFPQATSMITVPLHKTGHDRNSIA